MNNLPLPSPRVTLRSLLLTTLLWPIFSYAQPTDRIVPRHPYAVQLPELGRMFGIPGVDCGYGVGGLGFDGIYPTGDCNGDSLSDWIVARRPCDTTFDGQYPNDFLFYKGVYGGLPAAADRIRIGPTEIGSSVKFLATGDWDADSHVDMALSIKVFGDTSFGEPNTIGLSRVVILWGNAEGNYRIEDTTRLENGTAAWLTPTGSFCQDFNHDSIDDLLLIGVRGFQNGEVNRTMPGVQVFLGGGRWGMDRGRRSDWGCWSWPIGELSFTDQDVDGLADLVFYHNTGSQQDFGAVRIIYGKEGVIIDTANIVEVDLAPAWGKKSLFSDITGDQVPELLVNTGGQETMKAYVGFKGQRITEQFGSGDEPSHPGEDIWWGKPWAAIPLPAKLHDGWAASGWSLIFDFGDAGLDGINDVWVVSVPDYICYNGGKGFDSLYDGWIRIPGSGGHAVIGNVDGSGKRAIAFGSDGTIIFVQPTDSVPTSGVYRELPPGTDKVSEVASGKWRVASGLAVHAIPNPASGEVRIRWRQNDGTTGRRSENITVRITDAVGQEVLRRSVAGYEEEFVWNASKTFGGTYFITVTVGEISETTQVIIQR